MKLSITPTSIRFTQDTLDRLQVIAEREDRSIPYLVRKAVLEFLDRIEQDQERA
ncbi:hypothetical protein LEP3755_34340 [Leptolyngbya sp. NIES-3755]|nr:hypothetical protein LEP3755_34340 [Leptolyngbya sp. NIES-3755]